MQRRFQDRSFRVKPSIALRPSKAAWQAILGYKAMPALCNGRIGLALVALSTNPFTGSVPIALPRR
jgi:hypothetical protein